ncbi:3-deoxy-manno-octulosonate cytidylyltransferase [compost metagenome]
MKTIAIIQARMGSSRLPGKVMADIGGQPMIHRVVSRAQQAKRLDAVLVATSDHPSDRGLAEYCRQLGIACFQGSEHDVLDRYYQAALASEADVIVRLTADCPLLDPHVIDQVVASFHEGGADYVSNTLTCSYPDGLDTEVFHHDALAQAWKEATLTSEREHVTPFIHKQPQRFRLRNVAQPVDWSALRWTVDEPQDLEFVRSVYACFEDDSFGMDDVLAVLRNQPDLGQINAGFQRNEGYLKSLREDRGIEA